MAEAERTEVNTLILGGALAVRRGVRRHALGPTELRSLRQEVQWQREALLLGLCLRD
jgi:hypothetical protein